MKMTDSIQDVKVRQRFPAITNTWLILLLFIVATFIIGGAIALLLPGKSDLGMFLGYTIPMVIICIVVLMFQKHEFDAKFTTLFRGFDIQIVPYLLLFVLGFGYVSDYLTSLIPMPAKIEQLMKDMISVSFWGFLAICIAAPLLEEIFFRGILLRSYLINYSTKKAIVWSALFFAIIHLNPWQSIPAFGMGCFMGWLFYKTKSLLPSLIVHFLNNLIAFVTISVYGVDFSLDKMISWQTSLVIAVAGALLALASIYKIHNIFSFDEAKRI